MTRTSASTSCAASAPTRCSSRAPPLAQAAVRCHLLLCTPARWAGRLPAACILSMASPVGQHGRLPACALGPPAVQEFRRTKNDCGDCPLVHNEGCKQQWVALDDRSKERYGWVARVRLPGRLIVRGRFNPISLPCATPHPNPYSPHLAPAAS